MKVVIGIPTFRRPKGLRALMDSIARQQCDVPFEVIVCDNDGEDGAGLAEARSMIEAGFPCPTTLVAVPERGISQARNALLDAAFDRLGADLLAMVDDDEVVEPDWLAELVAMQAKTNADVVSGRVLPRFRREPSDWMLDQKIYYPAVREPGVVDIAESTANVLFAAPLYRRHHATFDPAFSLTGGGDGEYFHRIRKLGATFAYAPRAVSREDFGESRMTRRWAIQRAFRIGIGCMRVLVMHERGLRAWLTEAAKILVGIPLAVGGMVLLVPFSQRRWMRSVLILASQAGKIAGLLGLRHAPYTSIHGE